MEILTYPIGLVIGMLPVVASLDGPVPAELLLDGRPACTLTAAAPRCEVNVGRDIAVHRLELVRRDAGGTVVERTVRWLNRPGSDAEVYLSGSASEINEGLSQCGLSARESRAIRRDNALRLLPCLPKSAAAA